MALRTTLQTLIEMTRDEARLSSNTSSSTDHFNHVQRVVKRHYNMLCGMSGWSHLQIYREDAGIVTQAGQRYYDFPAKLNPLTIKEVWLHWGNIWIPVNYGIELSHYTAKDSDNNGRSSPIERWMMRDANQFEVWPMPNRSGDEVRFVGEKIPEQLINLDSRADMDDDLVALFAAGELLIENGSKDSGQLKITAANQIMAQQRRGLSRTTPVRMGLGAVDKDSRYYPRQIIQVRPK